MLPRDDLQRELSLTHVPQRLVVIGPGATETVFALGAGAKMVGRDSGSDYPPAARKVPIVADFSGPFFEKVVAARPDLIIVQGETWDKARVELWQQKCGAPVAALTAKSLPDVARGIEKIGAWVDMKNAAQALAKQFPAPQDFPAPKKVRAFFEVQRQPLWAAGENTLIDSALHSLGWQNAARIEGYKAYRLEALLRDDPDFYIVTAKTPNRERVLRELRALPGLRALRCIREGHVIVLQADEILRPGPRLLAGLKAMKRQAELWQTAP